jgi:hypothetical protein
MEQVEVEAEQVVEEQVGELEQQEHQVSSKLPNISHNLCQYTTKIYLLIYELNRITN